MRYEDMLDYKLALDSHIQMIADKITSLQRTHKLPVTYGDFQSYEHNGDYIECQYEDYRSCGTDYDTLSFPISYLDDDNWEDKFLEKIAADKIRKEEDAAIAKKNAEAQKIKDAEKKEAAERATYEELKKKFG